MNLQQFQRILRYTFVLPLLALAVTAGALYLQIRAANRTVNLIQAADKQISLTTLAAKLIVDEETGLRGFQTTGYPVFLEPYKEAQTELEPVFSSLNGMGTLDDEQRRRVFDLRQAHQTWQDGFARPVIALMRAGGDSSDLNLNLHGKSLMDGMRADIATIDDRAQARRAYEIDRWHTQVRWTLIVLVLLALTAGLVIALFTRKQLHAVSAAYRVSLDEVNRRADEIFLSEQQLRTTLTSIGDGVITCDVGGLVQMMNTTAEELTGWTMAEAQGRPLDEVFHIVNEETRQLVESPVAKVLRLNRVVGLANHTILIRRDGKELHIADSGAPIPNQDGTTHGIVMVFRDITAERRTQDALLANEKLAVAGRLAATIAHEIHNPLDSVAGLLYLMRPSLVSDESKQFMDMAEKELARVTEISRAMLGLYRESHTPILLDLRDTIRDILLLMERRFLDLGVRVDVDLPSKICVHGFPAELRQVFTNLITNAAEAAGPGGHIWVKLTAPPSGTDGHGSRTTAGAVITIADDGPGIPQDVLSQLFQPFFTTKGEQGTGLGLWVSRGIILKHGGSIDLGGRSGAGERGTVATIFLPTIFGAGVPTADHMN